MTASSASLRVSTSRGVARVTIDNPPVNVLGLTLMYELAEFLRTSAEDPSLKVIVFESADADFFLAHVDMAMGDDPQVMEKLGGLTKPGLNPFQAVSEAIRRQPQVTIVKLAGIARGGGAEFVAAADMSFAAVGKAGLAHCEALMGIVPGGGGTQYLKHKVGRGRALEVVLGAELFDAETAERYGWINRALPAAELDPFVDRLAAHIAALPPGVIAAAKAALPPEDLSDGLARENDAWAALVFEPPAAALISGGLKRGAQTRAGELVLETLLRDLQAGLAP